MKAGEPHVGVRRGAVLGAIGSVQFLTRPLLMIFETFHHVPGFLLGRRVIGKRSRRLKLDERFH